MFKTHNPDTVYTPASSYSHGIEVPPGARMLYTAGQIATDLDGNIPEGFAEQCELVWTNLYHVLEDAGMDHENLVKLTVYMLRPDDLPLFREIRDRYLQGSRPATTLIFISALARPEWLLEIEAVAAATCTAP